jgi:hypothetical protein
MFDESLFQTALKAAVKDQRLLHRGPENYGDQSGKKK